MCLNMQLAAIISSAVVQIFSFFFFPVLMSWVDVNKKILPRNKMCLMFLSEGSKQTKKKEEKKSCSEHLV